MTWPGAWPSFELTESRRSLENLRVLVLSDGLDDAPRSELARFLAVRSAGHIEFSLDQSLLEYSRGKSHARVAAFVESQLFRGRGVKPGQLIEKVSWVDSQWGEELGAYLRQDDEYLWRELNFLVDRRNKIAHGQSLGLGTVKAGVLAIVALTVGDWIAQRFDPS